MPKIALFGCLVRLAGAGFYMSTGIFFTAEYKHFRRVQILSFELILWGNLSSRTLMMVIKTYYYTRVDVI